MNNMNDTCKNEYICLSVIIPHYNSADSLRRLLNSIFISGAENIEVIVVDDNSNQDIEKLDEIKKQFVPRTMFFSNTSGQNSAGTCRNIGLDHASGKWVIFCDADDLLCNDWYETVSEDFDRNEDVIFYPPKSIDLQTGKPCGREIPYVKKIDDYLKGVKGAESRLRYNWFVPWSKMISRQLIEGNNIRFEPVMYSNDVLFSSKVGSCSKKIRVNNKAIYCVTRSVGGLTDVKNRASLFVRDDVAIRNHLYLKDRITYQEKIDMGFFNLPYNRLTKAIKNRYSVSEIKELLGKFKENGIKLITKEELSTPIRKILRRG